LIPLLLHLQGALLVRLLVVKHLLLLLLQHHFFLVFSPQLEAQNLLVVDLVGRSFKEALLGAPIASYLPKVDRLTNGAMRLVRLNLPSYLLKNIGEENSSSVLLHPLSLN